MVSHQLGLSSGWSLICLVFIRVVSHQRSTVLSNSHGRTSLLQWCWYKQKKKRKRVTSETIQCCILFLLRAAASIIFLVAAFASLAPPSPSACSLVTSHCFHVPGTGFSPVRQRKKDVLMKISDSSSGCHNHFTCKPPYIKSCESTATNQHARTDHQPSQNPHLRGISHHHKDLYFI